MATNNQLNLPLSGSTGTGNFVGANTPTLITPVLGVSTATSINFGVDALGNYTKRTAWTPVFTFSTPGDLSLSATSTKGWYERIGDAILLVCDYTFTATFTTASGSATITGLPFASVSGQGSINSAVSFGNSITYPVGTTSLFANISGSTSSIIFSALGSLSGTTLASTAFATGTSNTLRMCLFYYVA